MGSVSYTNSLLKCNITIIQFAPVIYDISAQLELRKIDMCSCNVYNGHESKHLLIICLIIAKSKIRNK